MSNGLPRFAADLGDVVNALSEPTAWDKFGIITSAVAAVGTILIACLNIWLLIRQNRMHGESLKAQQEQMLTASRIRMRVYANSLKAYLASTVGVVAAGTEGANTIEQPTWVEMTRLGAMTDSSLADTALLRTMELVKEFQDGDRTQERADEYFSRINGFIDSWVTGAAEAERLAVMGEDPTR